MKFFIGKSGSIGVDGVSETRKMIMFRFLRSYFDTNESVYKTQRYKGSETCVVDNVKLCGTFVTDAKKVACLTLRIQVS